MMKLWRKGHKWQLVLLFLVMASVLLRLVMAAPPFAGTLIKTYGHFPVAGTSWTIDVSEQGMTVGVITSESTAMKDSPPAWKPHPDWFVFVEDSDAWTYDGAGMVWVEVVTPKQVFTYTFAPHRDMVDTWGEIPNPPKEVFDRLPAKIQAVIRQKFPEGR
ncbi:MAG TPA: hypothetical protein VG733_03240 [Chthoniobacteraceae bacterium]|nr:hypothetical protein [Chthoniobacteraceae bacterium]